MSNLPALKRTYTVGNPCGVCASGIISSRGGHLVCANCGWYPPGSWTSNTPERGGPSSEGAARADDRGDRATGETGDDRPAAPVSLSSKERSFQSRVWSWCIECFQRPDSLSPEQRAFRFIEEAIELVQAIGTSREDVLRLVDYVYGRPPGRDTQEVGGVMVTLAALSQSRYLDMISWGEEELRRCIANTERIRAKDLAKPQRSPLPGASAPETEGNAALFDKIMKAMHFGLGRGSPTLEQEIRAALRLPEKSNCESSAPSVACSADAEPLSSHEGSGPAAGGADPFSDLPVEMNPEPKVTCKIHGVELAFDGDDCWECVKEKL